jgi:hypothetical protein
MYVLGSLLIRVQVPDLCVSCLLCDSLSNVCERHRSVATGEILLCISVYFNVMPLE